MTKTMKRIWAGVGLAVVFALVCGLALACIGTQGVAEAHESYFSTDAYLWEDGVFTEYSTGIYWYASGNPIPRRTNPVDPTKPTIIFAHGLKMNEGYQERDLFSLWFMTNDQFDSKNYDPYELEDQYYQTYINLGYNVGQFYWSQLSDDAIDCDKKIWSSTSEYGMRYFVNDGAGHRVQGDSSLNPTKSVAMIFGDAIREALGDDYALDLHLVGHSMGGQLVLATGEYLAVETDKGTFGKHLLPSQVTLVDPYFGFSYVAEGTSLSIDHLGGKVVQGEKYTAEFCADAMETLARHDVAIDAYGGGQAIYRGYTIAMAGEDDRIAELTQRLTRNCAWTFLESLANKFGAQSHCMIIDYYFSTLYEETIAKDNYGVEVPSAKASREYILSLRGKAFTQSLAEDKEGENPFYMHNSAYTRTNADYELVSDEYTAFVPFETPSGKPNLGLVVGLSVGAFVLAAGIAALLTILIFKKKKVDNNNIEVENGISQ